MATTMASNASSKGKSAMSQEQMVQTFNDLRQQQRMLASKISDIEMDMKEHDLVIDTLKGVDPGRKCFRMIGGVLVERIVGEVLPGLVTSRDKMKEFTGTLRTNLETKGKELNQFRETHGIQIRADDSKDEKDSASEKQGDRQSNILASV